MDALEVLRQMHVEAKAAFTKIEMAPAEERGGLWAKLKPELEVHEQIEDKFVYDPVARDAGPTDPVLARWEGEHEAQAREADAVIHTISGMDARTEGWLHQVKALATTLDGHIRHEEDDIWPRIRAAWGEERLQHAGRMVGAAKEAVGAGASVEEALAKAERAEGKRMER